MEKRRPFQIKLGRYLDKRSVSQIQSDIVLHAEPLGDSSRLPVGARGDIQQAPPPSPRPPPSNHRAAAALHHVLWVLGQLEVTSKNCLT